MTLKTRSARAKQAIQDQAMAELQDLIAEVDQLMSGTGSLAGKEGANLREQINSVLHRGRDAIERTRRGVVQRSQAAAEATEEYVEDHPWQTIGRRRLPPRPAGGPPLGRFRRQQKARARRAFRQGKGLGSGGDRRLQRPTQFPGSLQGFRLVTAGEGAGPHGAVHHQDPTGQQSLAAQRFGNGRPHQHGDFDSGHRLTPVIISLLIISARPFAMKHAAHNSLFHLRQNYPPPAPTAALPSRRL